MYATREAVKDNQTAQMELRNVVTGIELLEKAKTGLSHNYEITIFRIIMHFLIS